MVNRIDRMSKRSILSCIIEPSVLEAAAEFNVCRQLEACVWHQLYLRTWHGLPAIRWFSRNVYSAMALTSMLLRLSKDLRIVEVPVSISTELSCASLSCAGSGGETE